MISYLLVGLAIGFLIVKVKNVENSLAELNNTTATIELIEVCDIRDLNPKYNLYEVLLALKIPYPDIVFRQAILETGHFQSSRMLEYNNLFGIMKGDSLKQYNHWIESVIDYKKYFSNKYEGGDYYEFLTSCRYSTNPDYVKLLKQINLKPYNL